MPDTWEGEPGITGNLVQSRVTDKGGRHYFLVEPGRYRLTAFKSGFDFPSDILSGVKDDGDYLDVYHGEPINVNEKDVTIAVNIPLDPSQEAAYHTPAAVTRRARLRKIQGAVAILGILFSVVFASIRPTVFS
ncbi:MAG: hypothetical protein EBT21_04945, partial [Actinobacteria bacterium]|nr:hypothetical protein [Actinomycetota bacterium]